MAILVVFAFSTSVPIAGVRAANEETAVVDFGRLVPDADALALLIGHGLRPLAAKTLIVGFSGSYRAPAGDPDPPERFLYRVRAEKTENVAAMLRSNRDALRVLVERHTEAQLQADEKLLQWGRDLMDYQLTLEAGLQQLRDGDPLIFALHVSGPPDRIRNLEGEPGVSVVRVTAGDPLPDPQAPPQHPQGPIRRAQIQALGPAHLAVLLRRVLEGCAPVRDPPGAGVRLVPCATDSAPLGLPWHLASGPLVVRALVLLGRRPGDRYLSLGQ